MKQLVGIDLGTTHTVVARSEAREGAEPAVVRMSQLVTPTEVAARELLPSCLYAPLPHEHVIDRWGDAPWIVGELAQRRGADLPARFVGSAKSWLGYAAVDRTAAILPWGHDGDAPRISPVAASATYLGHVRRAYEDAIQGERLADQSIVLTVPASFDEAARELTLAAARDAGLDVRLLEEPQAAFYDWIHRSGDAGLEALLRDREDAVVLVCDVGGGTTDLSLIRVSRRPEPERVAIERVAVGSHLLLGGDNMDLALAHAAEPKLVEPPARLAPASFSQLVLACRAAKERLLGPDAPDDAPVVVTGAGSQLVGATRSTRVTRDDVERVVLEGFFPCVPFGSKFERRRSALLAFGLPYEPDVAITRHLAAFLAKHTPACPWPTAVLLNGGVFRASRIVDRVADVVASWTNAPVTVLSNPHPDFSVALGAVAYGLARLGFGRRIEAGAARGYYVAIGAPGTASRSLMCVVPRGTKEGDVQIVRDRPLAVVVGRPVRFDLFASDDAPPHRPGTIVPLEEDHFSSLPPIATKLEGATAGAAQIPVALEGELSPIGTLEVSLVETSPPDRAAPRRFRLAFDLRASPDGTPVREPTDSTEVRAPADGTPVRASTDGTLARASTEATSAEGSPWRARAATDLGTRASEGAAPGTRRLDEARAALARAFGKSRAEVQGREAKDLVRELERILGDRRSWTLEVNRTMFDALLPDAKARRRSADHERIFWMLAGYTVRPGFGAPRDAERIEKLAPLFFDRIAFTDQPRGWQQFWIAWRRVAGGLGEPTQTSMRDEIDPLLAPDAKRKRFKGWKLEAVPELLELASWLERTPASRRAELGGWVLDRTWTDRDPRLRAAIGRLGARIPSYASVHYVVAPRVAEMWLDHLLREDWRVSPAAAAAAVQIARRTGDRARDLSDSVLRDVQRKLVAADAPAEWLRVVTEVVALEIAERAQLFGDDLPIGLQLLDPAAR